MASLKNKIQAKEKYKENEVISSLSVTDYDNTKKEFAFATDANHVTTDTGYTVQQELDALRLAAAETVISEDGSTITIDNCIAPSKLLGCEIKGQTVVYKRAKDTEDEWVKVPSDEERDNETYDYKLESAQAVLDMDGVKYPFYEPIIIGTAEGLVPTDETLPTLVEGDILDRATQTITFADGTTRTLISSEYDCYKAYEKVISLASTDTKQDVFVQTIDGNGLITRNVDTSGEEYVDLIEPTIAYIDKKLIPTIPLTGQKINICCGETVGASEFSMTVPTKSGKKSVSELTLLNSYTGSGKASLLHNGDVEIALEVTVPSTFSPTVASLPAELRPKATRHLPCVVGNTVGILTINTDGTIALPSESTGKVEIKDTYTK